MTLLTRREAAATARVSVRTLYDWRIHGLHFSDGLRRLPFCHTGPIGGRVLIRSRDLDEWLDRMVSDRRPLLMAEELDRIREQLKKADDDGVGGKWAAKPLCRRQPGGIHSVKHSDLNRRSPLQSAAGIGTPALATLATISLALFGAWVLLNLAAARFMAGPKPP